MAMRTDDIGRDMQGKKIYPVTEYSKSQRIALLINIIHFRNPESNRHGAEYDTQAMLNLFHYLGYEVVHYQDLTAQEIDEALINFSKHPKLFNTDSVFVVLMSHGDLGTICGSDLKDFETDKIYERLNTKNCPALMNKPKVIIIQACRGGNDGVVKVSGSRQVMATEYIKSSSRNVSKGGIVHVEKDFIGFYSSTRYTTSYRNPGNGSCFIYYICDVISTYCHTDDIEELFKKVMRRFEDSPSGHKQMPTKERVTLTKHFYLLPDQSPTSPSAAPTPQVQRLHELIEKLPDNCRRAAETLWEACQQPDIKEELNQLFKCLEMKQPHTVCADAVKIYTYCTAEAFGADKDVLYQVNLSQQLLVESTDLQECNTVIVFCPINSCVRSDVEAAMSKAPGDKDIILVVMHHTRKTDYSTSGTEWSQIFPNVILHVDILFHETERGLLRCQKNVKAICQIQQELQKHNDISEPTNTVGEQGHLAPPKSQTSLVPKMQGSNNSDRHCLIL